MSAIGSTASYLLFLQSEDKLLTDLGLERSQPSLQSLVQGNLQPNLLRLPHDGQLGRTQGFHFLGFSLLQLLEELRHQLAGGTAGNLPEARADALRPCDKKRCDYPQAVRVIRKRHTKISARYGKGVPYAARRLSNKDRKQFAALLRKMRADDAHTRLRVVQVADGQVGCALQYSPTGRRPWMAVFYHNTVAEAVQAFKDLPYHKDRDVAHYRVEESVARCPPNPKLIHVRKPPALLVSTH